MRIFGNTKAVIAALGTVAATTCQYMANDVREKTKNYIGGNRTSGNPFPKNKVKKDGTYYKNSVARPYPKSPRFYVGKGGVVHPDTKDKPRSKLSLMQVHYRDDKSRARTIQLRDVGTPGSVQFTSPTFVVGPIGRQPGTPALLETGGTTNAWYREIKQNGSTVRWEFVTKKKGRKKTIDGKSPRPIRYGSWKEVNALLRARGKQVGGRRVAWSPNQKAGMTGPEWLGPKQFTLRPRPYISRAWQKTKNRSKFWIRKSLPEFNKAYRRLSTFITAA